MDLVSVLTIVLLIGFVQGFVFNAFSIVTRRIRNNAHLYLNLLVFFLSLNNLQAWLNASHIRFSNYYLADLRIAWYILLAPFFYLFLSEYLGFFKKKIVLRIGILFFISLTIIKLYFLHLNLGVDYATLVKKLLVFNQIAEAIGFLMTISIFIYSYKMYKKKENTIHKYKIDNLKWLAIFFKISLLILLLWVATLGVIILTDRDTYILLRISVSFLIYWIVYMATYKQSLFTERQALRAYKTPKEEVVINPITEDDTLLFNSITDEIKTSEVFTNPNLTIGSLSDELKMDKNTLSQIINQNTTNFTFYINQFRVEKAKEFLLNPAFSRYAIFAIGLEAGFNSKSTFYAVFKEFTGQTPKAWRGINT